MAAMQPSEGLRKNKKAGARPAFRYSVCRSRSSVLDISVLDISVLDISVLGDDRAAPAIIDADGDEIDVLADARDIEHGAGDTGDAVVEQGVGLVLHEHVIVFDAGRPVRGEAVFEAGADGAAPAAD